MITVVESFVVVVWLVLFSVGASIGFFNGVFSPLFSCHLGPPFLVFIVGVFLVIFDIFGGCLCCYDLWSSSSGSSRCCCGGRCFLGAVFAKCPILLQAQHKGFLPSTTTVIIWSRYLILWGTLLNPPLSRHMVKT